MLKNYEAVFISSIGAIGINTHGDKIKELKFDSNQKKIIPSNYFLKEVYQQLDFYFKKKLTKFDLPFILSGTEYQKKVLKKICLINYGKTVTYSNIAEKLKTHPRPVGNVCRKNAIQLLIPCHRVIGKNNIGGFAGEDIRAGGSMIFIKESLLSFEQK